jgi:mannitol/fructose-specific phosphotransferase system IIA component (Ntr-type)
MGWFDKFKPKVSSGPTLNAERAPSTRILRISDYLKPGNIAFFPAGPSKQQMLGSLIGSLELSDPGGALKSILAREEAGSTIIAPGLALPHARIMGISSIKAALGICPTGVQYSHTAGGPVHLMLLFLGPAENMREHLAFLAGASALFQQEGLSEALLAQTTPKAVLEKIRAAEDAL